MWDTLVVVGGAILTILAMVFGALWKGERTGRDKERLRQEQENQANEKARRNIDDAVRRTPTDGLHDNFYRD